LRALNTKRTQPPREKPRLVGVAELDRATDQGRRQVAVGQDAVVEAAQVEGVAQAGLVSARRRSSSNAATGTATVVQVQAIGVALALQAAARSLSSGRSRQVGAWPEAVAAAPRAVWVANRQSGTISRIDRSLR
jgi:hypothetical protein